MNYVLLYWILVTLMTIGALGELIPGMPGASLVLAGIVIWAGATGFAGINWSIIVVFAILVLSAAVEFFAAMWGAKRFGASKWGQNGAIYGLLLGVIGLLPALPVGGPIVGLLFGPFIGAFVAELLFRRRQPENSDAEGSRVQIAFKASLGTVVGSIIGNLIDGMLAVLAVIVFIVTTYPLIALL